VPGAELCFGVAHLAVAIGRSGRHRTHSLQCPGLFTQWATICREGRVACRFVGRPGMRFVPLLASSATSNARCLHHSRKSGTPHDVAAQVFAQQKSRARDIAKDTGLRVSKFERVTLNVAEIENS